VLIFRDISERRRVADENARLYAQARAANEAKDRFLAVLSHELRTPLTPIQASVELLRRNAGDPERVRRSAGVIERNVRLQASLVDDLLDLSRIARDKLVLDRRPVRLDDLVRETVEELRGHPDADGLELLVDLPPEKLWVEGDAFRLRQVLLNLVGNAAKFTPAPGRVRVRANRHAGAEGPALRVAVEDTGIGVSPEALPQIFRMFHQEAGTSRRGLGIGLALVESLVRAHGGRVWAESLGLGCGSCFSLELPAVPAPPEPGAQVAPAPLPAASSLRVLLVEDIPDSREVLAEALELLGYQVCQAATAEEALDRMADWPPDVLLSDIGLPGMDGCELVRRVRAQPAHAAIAAIAITGYGTADDRAEALAAGFDRHLPKPLDLPALHREIREEIEARRKGEA